jgi:hypothetical protein
MCGDSGLLHPTASHRYSTVLPCMQRLPLRPRQTVFRYYWPLNIHRKRAPVASGGQVKTTAATVATSDYHTHLTSTMRRLNSRTISCSAQQQTHMPAQQGGYRCRERGGALLVTQCGVGCTPILSLYSSSRNTQQNNRYYVQLELIHLTDIIGQIYSRSDSATPSISRNPY